MQVPFGGRVPRLGGGLDKQAMKAAFAAARITQVPRVRRFRPLSLKGRTLNSLLGKA